MVKLIPVVCVFLMLGCSVEKHTNQIQQSLKFESITIENNGAYSGYISSDETAGSCKDFILDSDEVIKYFKISQVATPKEYEHDLTASNCYASGSFVSSSDKKGTWKIDRARRGIITTSIDTKYYYCVECKSPLFYEP